MLSFLVLETHIDLFNILYLLYATESVLAFIQGAHHFNVNQRKTCSKRALNNYDCRITTYNPVTDHIHLVLCLITVFVLKY